MKPPSTPPVVSSTEDVGEAINDMVPLAETPPSTTPDFTSRQIYLNPAPAGIDARYAWTLPGGRGAGVRIIDLEWGWRFNHEDLKGNQGGVLNGVSSSSDNHGTAVLGEYSADVNSFGVTGICSDAWAAALGFTGYLAPHTAPVIRQAADRLRAGDILLLEIHRPGPRHNYEMRSDQRGFIAIEWWLDDFAAIRYAIARGIIVVEAAGNGTENFDDPLYDTPHPGFPRSWRNPLNPANPSSEAVIVGAGAPPPGTHGRNHGPDRYRLSFSNYGARVDAQGWGREVTTTGYGNLQGGPDRNEWSTDTFSGTSSASPIVVGALGCMQGILRARGLPLLTPSSTRSLLRSTGSPQQDATGRPRTQRIGNRPNLREMVARMVPPVVRAIPLYRYWNSTIGDHFYTTSWRELGRGRYGWRYEGVQCYVFPRRVRGSVPLYRYWNPRIGDHFYTTSWRELGSGRYGWRYEGVQCYVYPRHELDSVPLYRYWNPSIGDHFYTTNWRELGSGRHGWRYEGVQCYVMRRAIVTTSPDVPEVPEEQPAEIPPEFQSFAGDEWATETIVEDEEPVEHGISSFSVSSEEGLLLESELSTGSFETVEAVSFESEESITGSFETSFTKHVDETEKEVSIGSESFQLEHGESIEGVTVNVNVFKR